VEVDRSQRICGSRLRLAFSPTKGGSSRFATRGRAMASRRLSRAAAAGDANAVHALLMEGADSGFQVRQPPGFWSDTATHPAADCEKGRHPPSSRRKVHLPLSSRRASNPHPLPAFSRRDVLSVPTQDRKGVTPLMLACEGGHASVVKSLLQHGAPWNELDKDGHCAGEWASASGHAELASFLLDHAVRAELVLGVVGRQSREPDLTYLNQPVRYDGDDNLLDENNDAVMMSWEAPLMRAHAAIICASKGDVLNVGFGMGIIDGYIRDEHTTKTHTIIEAHPDVYAHLLRTGWVSSGTGNTDRLSADGNKNKNNTKTNIKVEFGRWQDVLAKIVSENEEITANTSGKSKEPRLFDGVFFDTYGEDWDDMREFHALLPKIMKPGGVYSYCT
jgi:ankyrin repeat protein